ncbi:MAG TPA: U32 family peptidase [Fibrobacteria bacterium]|nr:U32 family peptidase [Fibrobacteria bacterium]
MRAPELLSPAGSWDCAKAAVENGADAIYFGTESFNARMRADNFRLADLPELAAWLHGRGVRGYLTFNTLVFPSEMEEAERFLRAAIDAGLDAAIVQDVGICRLIREISPDFPIHASTQMTVASAAGARLARELGCSTVVLARENTLAEMARIQEELASDPMGLEVFVHGALCVAYSGQCLTSESLGGRSANRGVCAQACRMPYELLRDGEPVDLGERRYLLSPQDLAGIDMVPELVRLGIRSFKIEGRLKQASYVASITRLYRQAIDGAVAAEASGRTQEPSGSTVRYEMEMAFSRGLHTGWLGGIDNRSLVHARYPKKRGVLLGTVDRKIGQEVSIHPLAPLKAGDGVVFDADRPESREEGGRIWGVRPERDAVWLSFGDGSIDWSRVEVGQRIWKTSDPALERELEKTWNGQDPAYRRPVRARVSGRVGEPLALELWTEGGATVRARTAELLEPALRRPLDAAYLEAQIGRMGGSPFFLEGLESRIDGDLIVPVRALNEVRRQAVQELSKKLSALRRWSLRPETVPAPRLGRRASEGPPELVVLVRSEAQMEAAASLGVRVLYLELEFPVHYPKAVARWRELAPGREIWAAPPRISKPGEEGILRQVQSGGADGILARSWDHLEFFSGRTRLRGDFSLNVANARSASWFLERFALEGLAISYDLTAPQVLDLAGTADPTSLELTLHQHMPMFHMEHCVFCAFLSEGKDFRDCGRPCEKHEVRLRDHTGAAHPVKADAGCRNTVFNARAQTGAEFANAFIGAGLRRFRVEFLDESTSEMELCLDRYRRLLSGEIDGTGLWRELNATGQLGVTRGTLER